MRDENGVKYICYVIEHVNGRTLDEIVDSAWTLEVALTKLDLYKSLLPKDDIQTSYSIVKAIC